MGLSIFVTVIISLIAVLIAHILISRRDFSKSKSGFISELEYNKKIVTEYAKGKSDVEGRLFLNSAFMHFRDNGYMFYLPDDIRNKLDDTYIQIDYLNERIMNYRTSQDEDIKRKIKIGLLMHLFFQIQGGFDWDEIIKDIKGLKYFKILISSFK